MRSPGRDVGEAETVELDAAVDVWARARVAAGAPPTPARVERVHDKLRDPAALVVVCRASGVVVGMAQLEQHRDDPAAAHVSMVFVAPEVQGQGIGTDVLETAHTLAAGRGWDGSSLWTRESNLAARALYARVGYRPTDDTGTTPSGEPMRRWERILGA